MQKLRRILALLGVVILVAMYLITLVFALSSNPNADNMLMAAVACTVIIPCLLYGMILVTRVLDNRGLTDSEKDQADDPASTSTTRSSGSGTVSGTGKRKKSNASK